MQRKGLPLYYIKRLALKPASNLSLSVINFHCKPNHQSTHIFPIALSKRSDLCCLMLSFSFSSINIWSLYQGEDFFSGAIGLNNCLNNVFP